MKISSSNSNSSPDIFDTVQPLTCWWMFETMSEEETIEKRRLEYFIPHPRLTVDNIDPADIV
jgi:hypothetical protein